MVDLGAFADLGLLELDEIADLGPLGERVPGRIRANGPMLALAPMIAPSIWLKAWMVAPSATLTPGPNTTCGSTVTSRPSLVS